MEKGRSSLVQRFRSFRGGNFEALGVYRPMTLVRPGANRTRVVSRSGHCKSEPFSVSACRPVFQRDISCQDRFRGFGDGNRIPPPIPRAEARRLRRDEGGRMADTGPVRAGCGAVKSKVKTCAAYGIGLTLRHVIPDWELHSCF